MNTFEYLQPKSIDEAQNNFNEKSRLFAGGTDVLGLLKDHIESPEKLINLKNIPGLDKIEYVQGSGLKIGSMVKISAIAQHPLIREKYTVLAEAAESVASPQLRNVGTLGGNLCQRPRCWYFRGDFPCLRKDGGECFAVDGENKYHCIIGGEACYIVHPSDTAVALLALDAKIKISSNGKIKEVPVNDFFILPGDDILRENILQPGEVVTEVFIPEPKANMVSRYLKFTERGSWDFAIVSVAAVIEKSVNTIQNARIVWGGVAPKPWQDLEFNKNLQGLKISEDILKKVTSTLFEKAEPLEHNGYKVPLVKNLTKKILLQIA
ncbi:MAG: xanthine dehydrogenase family protein subunit M [Calditrichae bacterium]|nr:xanthine dehydrogenase family protein subunit M [Calditrichia bacterium]